MTWGKPIVDDLVRVERFLLQVCNLCIFGKLL